MATDSSDEYVRIMHELDVAVQKGTVAQRRLIVSVQNRMISWRAFPLLNEGIRPRSDELRYAIGAGDVRLDYLTEDALTRWEAYVYGEEAGPGDSPG